MDWGEFTEYVKFTYEEDARKIANTNCNLCEHFDTCKKDLKLEKREDEKNGDKTIVFSCKKFKSSGINCTKCTMWNRGECQHLQYLKRIFILDKRMKIKRRCKYFNSIDDDSAIKEILKKSCPTGKCDN